MVIECIEELVCDLKWSKLLYVAGVRQDTFFHWVKLSNDKFVLISTYEDLIDISAYKEKYAAFTAQELVYLYPKAWEISKRDGEWRFLSTQFYAIIPGDNNLSNTLARVLLRLMKDDKQLKIESDCE